MYKIIGADQKEYGPVSADQLRQWIAEGRVNGQTRVQAAAATEWKTITDFPEFAGLLPKTPLPPPLAVPIISPLPARPGNSQMAVWAMVTGIIAVLCCQFLGPVAIVLGAVALSQLKSHPELTGRGFAITAIALGIVSLLLVVLAIVLVICSPQFMQSFQNAMP
jgi:hypothetical protein